MMFCNCKIGLFILLLGTVIFLNLGVLKVEALVPSIMSVNSYDVNSQTWLNITISHTPPPQIGLGHYVSIVQVEVNGTEHELTQSPQSTIVFSVQYNIGPNTNSYTVRTRALCNLHGYSAKSDPVAVPEFSSIFLPLFLLFVTVLVASVKKLGYITNVRSIQSKYQ